MFFSGGKPKLKQKSQTQTELHDMHDIDPIDFACHGQTKFHIGKPNSQNLMKQLSTAQDIQNAATPLNFRYHACLCGHKEILQILLKNGKPLNHLM